MDEIITCQRGEPVELRLPAAIQWGMAVNDPEHILASVAPQGEADATGQSRVWRFDTVAVGTATVLFSGRPIITAGRARPYIVMAREFAITVQ